MTQTDVMGLVGPMDWRPVGPKRRGADSAPPPPAHSANAALTHKAREGQGHVRVHLSSLAEGAFGVGVGDCWAHASSCMKLGLLEWC